MYNFTRYSKENFIGMVMGMKGDRKYDDFSSFKLSIPPVGFAMQSEIRETRTRFHKALSSLVKGWRDNLLPLLPTTPPYLP